MVTVAQVSMHSAPEVAWNQVLEFKYMWKDLNLGIQVGASTGVQIAGVPAVFEVLVLWNSWGVGV